MKNILLIIATVLVQLPCKAQNLANSRISGHNDFIYRLTPREARKIYQKGAKIIDSTFYHSYIASLSDDEKLPQPLQQGYYLRVRAQKNKMFYELEPVVPFEVKILKNNIDLLVSVYDTTGKRIKDAICRTGLRRIPFDKKTESFRISRANCKGLLTITHKGFDGLYYIEREKYNPACLRISKKVVYSVPLRYAYIPVQIVLNVPRDIYNLAARGRTTGIIYIITKPFRDIYHTIYRGEPSGFISSVACIFSDDYCNKGKKTTNGFSAFNKPIYKPGDTLRTKFYVLDHKNKPYKKDFEVYIERTYPDFHKRTGYVKPYRDGFYETEIVLHDSLKLILDKDYSLNLKNKRGRIITSGNFRYEEYKLKSMKCDIRSDKESHYPHEPKILYLEVMNENELNVPDARAEIVVRATKVRYEEACHIFVPDILWKHNIKLDPVGETKIQIPDSVFPDISFHYEIEVLFLNSENETKKEKLVLEYRYENRFIFNSFDRDSLYLKYFKNGNSAINIPANIEEYNSENRQIRNYSIQLPDVLPVNPIVARYIVHSEGIQKIICLSDEQPMVKCMTKRTSDSLFIHVENPRNLELNYNIYCKNRELTRGSGKVPDYRVKTTTGNNYFLSLQYIWAGESKNEEYTIPFNSKNLNVQIIHPKVVYPGQQTNMKILVTDQDGNPTENVDITAYANTARFNEKIPAVPYLGKKLKGRVVVNNFAIKNIEKKNISSTLDYNFWKDHLGLDSIEYYRFLYPEDGVYHSFFPVKDGITQFAPFVFRDGAYLPVRVIYLDNVPVYFGHANTMRPYSFSIFRPGYHHLRLRMYNSEIILDSVYIAPDVKTVLSLDITKKNPDVKKINKPYKFTSYEKELLERYTLYINTTSTDEKVEFIEQNGNYQVMKEPENRWKLNIIAGPVKPSMITYGKVQDFRQPFRFEPGYSYEISSGLVKMRCLNKQQRINYWNDYSEKKPSESLFSYNEILQQWNHYLFSKRLNESAFRNPQNTIAGNGKLRLGIGAEDVVKHNLKYFLLFKSDEPQFVRVNNISQLMMHDLKPGFYRAVFVGDFQHFFEADSLLVQSDGTSYYGKSVPEMLLSDAIYKKIDNLLAFQLSFPNQQVHPRNKVFNDIVTEYNSTNRINLENAQQITGRITDPQGNSLPGVNVIARGTAIGSVSDINGYYSLYVPSEVTALDFSFIGYMTETVPIGFSNKINCTMVEDFCALEEVVVIGYGVQKKYDLTASVSTVNSGITGMLQGRVSGMDGSIYIPGASAPISIRGFSEVESGSPLYIVDGIPYEGVAFNLDPAMIGKIEILQGSQATAIYGARAANGVILITTGKGKPISGAVIANDEKLFGGLQHSSIRKNFSDYAFWKPRLTTDNNGVASFDITFPDDVTSWKTFILAAGNKKFTGSAQTEIKSYKPVLGLLALPDFLVESDSSLIIGKSINYTSDTMNIIRRFKINDSTEFEDEVKLVHSVIDTLPVIPANSDTLKIAYIMEKKADGYFDGEERKLPVIRKGTVERVGQFYNLFTDTVFTMTFNPDAGKVTFYAQSNLIDIMLEQTKWLHNYVYMCNEQMASKLKGLIIEKKLMEMLGQNFRHEYLIRNLVKRLENSQRVDGLWGWWPDTDASFWISLHVLEALMIAKNAGYAFRTDIPKLTEKLVWYYHHSDCRDKIRIMKILKVLDAKVDYEGYLIGLEKEFTGTFQKYLELTELKQILGMKYQMDSLYNNKKTTMPGNIYWGEQNYSVCGNHIDQTLIAYRIIRHHDRHSSILPLIRNYLLEQRNAGGWSNTYVLSKILETILPEIEVNDKKIALPVIETKGSLDAKIEKFPFETEFMPGDSLRISKEGNGTVYLTAYQSIHNSNPEVVDDNFRIITRFVNGDTVLITGKTVTLCADVEVKADAEYVMLEVPVPAGCYYEGKKQGNHPEVYREYYKDRVCFFFEKLPKGKYQFDIELISKFKGVYTLNPARIELMYFPTFFGRNMLKKVAIQ